MPKYTENYIMRLESYRYFTKGQPKQKMCLDLKSRRR